MTPVERAAAELTRLDLCLPTRDRLPTARAVFESIDVDELAAMLARIRFQEDMPHVIARTMKEHLTKGDESDE